MANDIARIFALGIPLGNAPTLFIALMPNANALGGGVGGAGSIRAPRHLKTVVTGMRPCAFRAKILGSPVALMMIVFPESTAMPKALAYGTTERVAISVNPVLRTVSVVSSILVWGLIPIREHQAGVLRLVLQIGLVLETAFAGPWQRIGGSSISA